MSNNKPNIYDQIFRHVFLEMKYCLSLVSQDVSFQRTLKATFKHLGLEQSHVFINHELTPAIAEARNNLKRFNGTLFFIEGQIGEKNNILEFTSLKSTFAEKCKLICLSNEVSRDTIVQIYEMGADNVIIKPASVNAIIQKTALTVKPNNKLSENIEKCQGQIEKGELEEAEETAEKILKEKPESAAGLMLKGDIRFYRNELEEAEKYYLRAAKQNKLYLKPLHKLVEVYQAQGDLENQLKYLKKLDNLSPLNHKRKIKLGETYIALDEDEEAQQYFEQAVRQVQKQAAGMVSSVLMQIAREVKESRPQMATEFMDRAIESKGELLNQEDLWMFNEMGIQLRQQGKWETAIEYYQRALKLAPMDGGLYYNLGMAYSQGKQHYKALQQFEKAMELYPEIVENSSHAAYQIARTHYNLQNNPQAEKYLKKALASDPKMQSAQQLLQKIRS